MRPLAGALGALALSVGVAQASHLAIDTEGHTTLEQILVETNPNADYTTLEPEAVNEAYLVRDGVSESNPAIANAQAGREQRRRSLAYVSQMTDFQLADEESPTRVEFLDGPFGQAGPPSSWRPSEALNPFVIDASVRQINRFAPASPVPQGDGSGNAMDFALITGDQADNQQRNETVWVRELLEGGDPLTFNSGLTNPSAYSIANLPSPTCQAFVLQEGGAANAAAEGARYTGVQDFGDYPLVGITDPPYWDPDDVTGDFAAAGWPTYTGLMDRAQMLTITPDGLDVPSYITNGNHDVLLQGNEDATAPVEALATGCTKPLLSAGNPANGLEALLALANVSMLIPPDPQRQYVSKLQIKQIYGATTPGDDDHGFKYVDTSELGESNGSASYYAWDPAQTPGVRFINVDTNSEGGVLGPFGPQPTGSSDGNIDDPQFSWLVDELDAAQDAGKLIVLFGHHPVRTLDSAIPDEAAAPCTVNDPHGHDVNPGCELDTRLSLPLHFGTPEQAAQLGSSAKTFSELLSEYPNVVAYVSGHTHENKIIPYEKDNGEGAWWEIGTSAVADYPQQSRLIDVMDNRDRTLSIFGTILEHASPATAPAPGNASGFTNPQLASVGRTIAYNDLQIGGRALDFQPLGLPTDQNVELLLGDPREADLFVTIKDQPDPVAPGADLTYRVRAINSGPSIATGVTLTNDLPGGVEFESATPESGSCDESGGDVTCDLGDIPNGATREVEIVVTPEEPGSLLDRAKVEGILEDPDGADDRATEETTVSGDGGGGGGKCKGSGAIRGTNGADDLLGTGGRDVMQALRANDRVRGRRGKDKLCGGRGHDRVGGGGGRDFVKGNRGQDIVRGQRGRDRVKGNQGGDLVAGGRGRDVVKGHRGHDILSGGPGFDVCWGGPGRDVARPSCEEVHSASSASGPPPL